MPGVQREVAEHRLNVKHGSVPIRQCQRPFNQEKREAIKEEVEKLLGAGFYWSKGGEL